jgi:hypothetical protein
MLARAKRASHIDPPASSYAIMRRARPYRGENPEPGKDVLESLTTGPELENRLGQKRTLRLVSPMFAVGTAVASRPPHRSVQAQFGHTAPTSSI